MNRFVLLILGMLLLSACTVSINSDRESKLPPAVAGTEQQQEEASRAAKDIIHSIDRGEYSAVWRNSSQLLKNASSEFVFTKLLSVTRGNLGKPELRPGFRIGFTPKIDPDLPEGDYCIFEADTTFGRKLVTEKVVMQRVAGEWKLAGYFMSSKTKFSPGG